MLSWQRRVGFSERGQALVEFILIVPILLLILMAIIGFGHTLFAKMIVAQAANRAARVGSVLYGSSKVSRGEAHQKTREAALSVLNTSLPGKDRTVMVRESGPDLYVIVQYRTRTFVPLLRPWLGDTFQAEHVAVYRIEGVKP